MEMYSDTDKIHASLADLQHQLKLLQLEYDYERETYRQQTQQMGIACQIRRGLCWYPATVKGNRYNSLNQMTIEIEREDGEDTEHVFEYGRPVCFFSVGERVHYLNFQGVISYVQENKMVVVVPGVAAVSALQACHPLGVQLYFDDTSYKVMTFALREVMNAKGNRTAELREILIGRQAPVIRAQASLRFPWLNASQEKAVNRVLNARDVAIVHGPPGTGKTTTLVEAVYETLQRENQVLVCAQSNAAVDWIAEKLADRGVNVLRIGNPTRVNDKMLSFTYERRFEAHPDYPELWHIRKTVREMAARVRNDLKGKGSVLNQLAKLRRRMTELEIGIDAQLFGEARVIAATLVGTANRVLERKRFSTLFIDEAAQALEAACWIGILRAERVILAGDYCQLPPTIKCPEALSGGLGRTLIERVARTKPETVSMLNMQYRMNEEIMRFPSGWFYHHQLRAAPEVQGRGILEYDTPVVWIDTADCDFGEKQVSGGTGRLNTDEARLLSLLLKQYMEKVGLNRIREESIDFGIISPYRAQVQYLRQMIRNDLFFRPFRKLITIHTVDGFQGQERDVIFISLVRANDEGQIGFLRDLRRMNVAITRARMKLVILGDASTLTRHPFYQALYEYIGQTGEVRKIEPPD